MGKGADMGVGKKTSRKRAVGTREHIIAHLGAVDELFDANGMASTQLATAVGYPGSSVAFAQLLSGMERSGLIEREVRGKRTYRISLGPEPAKATAEANGRRSSTAADELAGINGPDVANGPRAGVDEAGAGGFDYDELARRLLVQVVRHLAAAEPRAEQPDPSTLHETVTGLEHELASAWTRHGKLAEENVKLREQLKAAQHSLALARERVRRLPVSADLDSNEVVQLQRLLSPAGGDAEGIDDIRSLLS